MYPEVVGFVLASGGCILLVHNTSLRMGNAKYLTKRSSPPCFSETPSLSVLDLRYSAKGINMHLSELAGGGRQNKWY